MHLCNKDIARSKSRALNGVIKKLPDLVKDSLVDAIRLLYKLVPLLFLGLYFSGVAHRIPKVMKVGIFFKPLCALSRLPSCCSVYFTLCLLNPSAATMNLVDLRKKGILEEKDVIVASLSAGLPIFLYFIFFAIAPVALPFLGIAAGMLYLFSLLGCGFFQTMLGIVIGNIWLENGLEKTGDGDRQWENQPLQTVLKVAFWGALKNLHSIVWLLAAIVFLVALLEHSGVMSRLAAVAEPLLGILRLPSQSFTLISASAMNLVAACGMAEELMTQSLLTGREIVISLIAGAFLFNLGELWHTVLPYNISFFGFKLGIKVSVSLWTAIGISEIFVLAILIALRM